MQPIKNIPGWLRNKYLLTSLFFLAWMIFFDHNDLFLQIERSRELSTLNAGIDFYRAQIDSTRHTLEGIRNDPSRLEKIARERYLMKREEEQVFVIDRE
ncbi:MAG: septum formation initiator family protein [Chitinophagaceae bacterium]|jgi:cell division protein DivIC|nr:septum formation initiator family protein [Chitinophagaceae bacterium]